MCNPAALPAALAGAPVPDRRSAIAFSSSNMVATSIPRHADLISCGMAGVSLLHGGLDVNGRDGGKTARTHPTGA
jgi:hypothetical protein